MGPLVPTRRYALVIPLLNWTGVGPSTSRAPGRDAGHPNLGKLLPEDESERCLERLALARDVLSQRQIDERLVVPAARRMHLLAEPSQDGVVKADRDSGPATGGRQHGAPLSLPKVVPLLHCL